MDHCAKLLLFGFGGEKDVQRDAFPLPGGGLNELATSKGLWKALTVQYLVLYSSG